MLARLLAADARAAAGKGIDVEDRIAFRDLETLWSALTPKRLGLLRHLHQHPAASVRVLASALGRQYRRVHEDVEVLAAIGLITRDGTAVLALYSEIKIDMRLDLAAVAAA